MDKYPKVARQFRRISSASNQSSTPIEEWSPHIYSLCVIVTSSILIILYSLALYRSCKESFMVCLRDVCLNESIWFFSFRYWAISFAMPWKLKQIEMPRTFKILAFSIFLIVVLLNIIFPILYAYYGFLLNTAIDSESKEEAERID